MKKVMSLLFMATALMATISCDSDDDLPVARGATVQVNTFCYGDQTTNFFTTGAYRDETIQISNTAFLTNLDILGQGLTLNGMNELQGTGVLMELSFYGSTAAGFQTGVYDISTLEEPANVSLSYSLDHDPSSMVNAFLDLTSGIITVETFQTGFSIDVDGMDENGDEFHGIYLGNVPIIE